MPTHSADPPAEKGSANHQPANPPTSTYRLQFNRTFTFRDAAAVVPYLASLGISHCYASPYLKARPGSMHGYDIIDHNALNPETGTHEDYEHFISELHRHGMGQILDIVPNHMGVMGSDNAWWLDVLENGEASEYAEFFDIDWRPLKEELQGKVLIPILEDQYGNVLERAELNLRFNPECGEFSIFYHEHRFPIDPATYPQILALSLKTLHYKIGETHEDFLELQSVSTAFTHLPGSSHATPAQKAERAREKEVQKRRLAAVCQRSPDITDFINRNVQSLNGKSANGESRNGKNLNDKSPNAEALDPASFDALHALIKVQAYRLAQWRAAADDINYRRFFDINDLAALCMDNQAVFDKTHRLILDLAAQGRVNGFRIDHPDGLHDPKKYLLQLHNELKKALPDPNATPYIVVEKILTGDECLREDWPIQGTTGYEFANLVNNLFVDPAAASKMERIYKSFTGHAAPLPDLIYDSKKLILKVALASELNVLANLLSRIALADRHTCDFTLNSLRTALAEIIASFPVYRTYVSGTEVSDADRLYVHQAMKDARKRTTAADLSVFDFIERILLIEVGGPDQAVSKRQVARFAMKFQQVTSAVMAKGLEDTAFYRYHSLDSLNDVGGNPGHFGATVEEFHLANRHRAERWPSSMLASSTHDSKRSEDVRARINVLSEIPALWRLELRKWRDWNRGKKLLMDGQPAPNRNDEYLLYQTLIGACPAETLPDDAWRNFSERIEQYMLKAARESKESTSWGHQNSAYEEALQFFTRAILDRQKRNRFLPDFMEFQRRTAHVGAFNSLSQCLLKLTCPGVPDIYQGNEFLELDLVDPDNRRPVDYEQRKKALDELQRNSQSPRGLKQGLKDQAVRLQSPTNRQLAKLFVVWRTLRLRSDNPSLFQQGNYTPLQVTGPASKHVCAFMREHEGKSILVAVPRLCATLLYEDLPGENKDAEDDDEDKNKDKNFPTATDFATIFHPSVWGDTRIEIPHSQTRCYHNAFTGDCIPMNVQEPSRQEPSKPRPISVPLSDLLKDFPVALAVSDPLSL